MSLNLQLKLYRERLKVKNVLGFWVSGAKPKI
jgi:hypothetical protein